MGLLCFLLRHDESEIRQDGLGAGWTECLRCGAILTTHSWHGGKPWLGKDDPGPTHEPHRSAWLARKETA